MSLFTLIKATPSTKGGHILKLQAKDTKRLDTGFGIKTNTSQTTYYMKVASVSVAVGASAELDVSQFNIVERPHTITESVVTPNGTVQQPKEIMLKWLQLK